MIPKAFLSALEVKQLSAVVVSFVPVTGDCSSQLALLQMFN